MELIKQLYDQKRNLWAQAEDLKNLAKDENRELNEEEFGRWEKFLTDMDAIDKRIQIAEKDAAMSARMSQMIYDHKDKPTGKLVGDDSVKYDAAFEKWLRFGAKDLSDEERSILNVDQAGRVGIGWTKELRQQVTDRLEKRTSDLANPTYVAPISLAAQFETTKKAIG